MYALVLLLKTGVQLGSKSWYVRPSFFYFLFYRFFSQLIRVGGRNKNKNKIHSDHFPIEIKSKETQFHVSFNFNSNFYWKMVCFNFIFILPIKMAISHQVLSLRVI